MKKHIVFFSVYCLSFCIVSNAQQLSDTSICSTVFIYGNYFNDGAKKESVDSFALSNSYSNSLQSALQQTSSITIKSYGNEGSSSSISMRGAGSSRTLVTWEGFPLNSLSMGGNDCSVIPVANFNSIAINNNASATYFGSGAVGGAIELQNIPDWKKHTKIIANYSEGSFSTNSYVCTVSKGNEKLDYSGSVMFNESKGNFPYKDYSNKSLFRENAEYTNYGTFQNIHILLSPKSRLQAGIWYQVKQNNIPAIMGSKPFFKETQTDSTFKVTLSYKYIFKNSFITYKTAYFNDIQLYSKIPISNFGSISKDTNHNIRNFHILQYKSKISKSFKGLIEAQSAINTANISSYKEPKTEYSNSIIGAIQYITNTYQSNISVRKEFNSQYTIPVIYNIGNQFIVKPEKISIRASAGNKYRTPTFNDLYWENWGNPDLIPESGFSFECGGEYTCIKKTKHSFTTNFTYFNSTINNMILWNQQGAFWHPFNLAQAKISGYEISIKHDFKKNKIKVNNTLKSLINTSFISKVNSESNSVSAIGHSIYYEPKLSISIASNITYNNFRAFATSMFQTQRYYSLINTLPPYAIGNIGISYLHTTNKLTSIFSLQCNNIWNTAYETVRSYPMPGRFFEFNLQLIYNK